MDAGDKIHKSPSPIHA